MQNIIKGKVVQVIIGIISHATLGDFLKETEIYFIFLIAIAQAHSFVIIAQ